ncbi:nitrogen fixation protein NifZ, partial [Paraburkholderia phymatum]
RFYIYAVHFVETDRKVGMRAKELCTLDHLPDDVLACLGERAKGSSLAFHSLPAYRWRIYVAALDDLHNYGGYPDRSEGECLVTAGSLGEIVAFDGDCPLH